MSEDATWSENKYATADVRAVLQRYRLNTTENINGMSEGRKCQVIAQEARDHGIHLESAVAPEYV